MIKTVIAGTGMVKFIKPRALTATYDELGMQAIQACLADAGVEYHQIERAYAGYTYGDYSRGQKVLYNVGMTGIPVINTNNNCASGSTALYLAREAIQSGMAECVLAVGFDQMPRGALPNVNGPYPDPFEYYNTRTKELFPVDVPFSISYFCGAGATYMEKYGASLRDFALIRVKASRHAAQNPMAVWRAELSVDDVLRSRTIVPGVCHLLMACPSTSGAAAAVLVSEAFAKKHNLNKKVQIIGQVMTTDENSVFETDIIEIVGAGMTRNASQQVYEQAGIGPEDIDVVELHDCFAQNEIICYESLALCGQGEGVKFIHDGDNTYGGKFVTNPSGGLLTKGHPLGATGLAQCHEIVQHLRGVAGKRQVEGARLGLQQNAGVAAACVVTLYALCD